MDEDRRRRAAAVEEKRKRLEELKKKKAERAQKVNPWTICLFDPPQSYPASEPTPRLLEIDLDLL